MDGTRRRLLLIAATASAAFGATVHRASAQSNPLGAYRWRARPLLVFAPRAAAAGFAEQVAVFRDEAAALRERDMPLFAVAGGVVQVDGRASAFSEDALRRHAGVVCDDRVIVALFGKDGGLKLLRAAPVAAHDVFALVDRMPMRRREMRGG